MALSWNAPLRPVLPRPASLRTRCGSGGLRRIGVLTDGFWSGGIRLISLGGRSWLCPIMTRLRRRTRWWGVHDYFASPSTDGLQGLRGACRWLVRTGLGGRMTPHRSPGANAQLRRFCADLGRLLVASRPVEGYDEGPGAPKESVSRENGPLMRCVGRFWLVSR